MEELEETEPSSTSAPQLNEDLIEDDEDFPPDTIDNDKTPHIYGGPNIFYNRDPDLRKKPEDSNKGSPPRIDGSKAVEKKPDSPLFSNYPNIKKLDTDVRPPVTGSFSPVVPLLSGNLLPPDNSSFIRYFTRKLGLCVLLFQVEGGLSLVYFQRYLAQLLYKLYLL